ncbi:6,7,8-trihydroxycoumarin synthase-like [Salvia miltiorrhiza]|uniref:6,7,8-trihydroxycoumarin synthase-like n=1 Tax=Salvia miltiorrhiza TaxID=226208 RepID=UPI0025AB74EC|nr:6,7,8-trihydroxycoumarin synthase-like [Salvia miltiorrhiza]
MILLLSIIVPIIVIYLLHKCKTSPQNDVVRLPPGPPGLPLIGNLLQIGSAADLPFYLWQLSKKYGPIMQMRIGCVPMLIISSPKLAQEVMKTQDLAFCNRTKFLGQKKLSYNCTDMTFSPYGEYWREVRKITAVHLFSLKKKQSFRPIREDEVSRMVAKIRSLSSSESQEPRPVDLSHVAMTLGRSLISRFAFGKRYDGGGPEARMFEKLLHDAEAALMQFYVSDYFPSLMWVDRLSGAVDRVDRIFDALDSFYQKLIDEHLDPRRAKEEKEEEEDILDVLIKIKEEKLSSIDFDWDRVKALLADIFIAGTDTSAASIVWTMTALIKAPKVMQKVQAEIRNLVGKKGEVDEDDFANLPYLKAVIKETFRLYPPAPLLVPRQTIEKCTLEGYEIQPKTVVYVNAWAIARDAEYWKNPDEFVPERFLNSTIDFKGQDFELIPFGSGRRVCPGMLMGLSNVELTVANLLYSFDWELPAGIRSEDIDTDPLPGITMHKKNPLLLVAKKYDV